jgi:hypothetical protein
VIELSDRSRHVWLNFWPTRHDRPLPFSLGSNRVMAPDPRCVTSIGGLTGLLGPPCSVAKRYNSEVRSDFVTAWYSGQFEFFIRAFDGCCKANELTSCLITVALTESSTLFALVGLYPVQQCLHAMKKFRPVLDIYSSANAPVCTRIRIVVSLHIAS